MFTLSGFADEIDDELATQLDVLDALGINHLDLRSVGGTNVLELTDEEVHAIEETLDVRGFTVGAIGSPIGKIGIEDDFEPHRAAFERALELAERFDAAYIRVFSYWIPEGEDPADYREDVLDRLRWQVERAEAVAVRLLHENEKDIYGDTPARCRDLVTALDSNAFSLVFDPANFLEVGVEPYPDALLHLVEHVDALHVKDAVLGERGAIKPAGEGDGRIPETVRALHDRGFEGYASLEPHLAAAFETGGYSGPEAFTLAGKAFIDILEASDLTYE